MIRLRIELRANLCFIGSENKMKGILQRLVRKGLIEFVPGTTRYSAAYRLKNREIHLRLERSNLVESLCRITND
jgi:hypothetical protein